jgi:3-oxoacyl-[acyl-carrier protein] reductase
MLMYNPPLDLKPEIQQQYLKDCPLRRVGQPDEVADAAVFLATNRFANNCVLNLDGGLSAV